jgi:hypothetical protein
MVPAAPVAVLREKVRHNQRLTVAPTPQNYAESSCGWLVVESYVIIQRRVDRPAAKPERDGHRQSTMNLWQRNAITRSRNRRRTPSPRRCRTFGHADGDEAGDNRSYRYKDRDQSRVETGAPSCAYADRPGRAEQESGSPRLMNAR